jgi:hypothetical protein
MSCSTSEDVDSLFTVQKFPVVFKQVVETENISCSVATFCHNILKVRKPLSQERSRKGCALAKHLKATSFPQVCSICACKFFEMINEK